MESRILAVAFSFGRWSAFGLLALAGEAIIAVASITALANFSLWFRPRSTSHESLPHPTGPYKIGVSDCDLPTVGVRVLYPASAADESAAAAAASKQVDSPYLSVPGDIGVKSMLRLSGLSDRFRPVMEPMLHVRLHATTDAPLAHPASMSPRPTSPYPAPISLPESTAADNVPIESTSPAPPCTPEELKLCGWPVLIFSHGNGASRETYSALLTDIASHGWVVLALEHRDGSAGWAKLPKGGESHDGGLEQSATIPINESDASHDVTVTNNSATHRANDGSSEGTCGRPSDIKIMSSEKGQQSGGRGYRGDDKDGSEHTTVDATAFLEYDSSFEPSPAELLELLRGASGFVRGARDFLAKKGAQCEQRVWEMHTALAELHAAAGAPSPQTNSTTTTYNGAYKSDTQASIPKGALNVVERSAASGSAAAGTQRTFIADHSSNPSSNNEVEQCDASAAAPSEVSSSYPSHPSCTPSDTCTSAASGEYSSCADDSKESEPCGARLTSHPLGWLRGNVDLSRVVIAGHSFGGAAALGMLCGGVGNGNHIGGSSVRGGMVNRSGVSYAGDVGSTGGTAGGVICAGPLCKDYISNKTGGGDRHGVVGMGSSLGVRGGRRAGLGRGIASGANGQISTSRPPRIAAAVLLDPAIDWASTPVKARLSPLLHHGRQAEAVATLAAGGRPEVVDALRARIAKGTKRRGGRSFMSDGHGWLHRAKGWGGGLPTVLDGVEQPNDVNSVDGKPEDANIIRVRNTALAFVAAVAAAATAAIVAAATAATSAIAAAAVAAAAASAASHNPRFPWNVAGAATPNVDSEVDSEVEVEVVSESGADTEADDTDGFSDEDRPYGVHALPSLPLLICYSDEWHDTNDHRVADVARAVRLGWLGRPADSQVTVIRGSTHISFSDVPLLLPTWLPMSLLKLAGVRSAAWPTTASGLGRSGTSRPDGNFSNDHFKVCEGTGNNRGGGANDGEKAPKGVKLNNFAMTPARTIAETRLTVIDFLQRVAPAVRFEDLPPVGPSFAPHFAPSHNRGGRRGGAALGGGSRGQGTGPNNTVSSKAYSFCSSSDTTASARAPSCRQVLHPEIEAEIVASLPSNSRIGDPKQNAMLRHALDMGWRALSWVDPVAWYIWKWRRH